jgi:NADPH:quinone reductase
MLRHILKKHNAAHTTKRWLRRQLNTSCIVCTEFGSPDVMKYVESHEIRDEISDDEIVVNVRAAGVNPSDTYVRLGDKGPYKGNKKLIPELPYTPGKDGAGVVEKVGSSVTEFKKGDRIYISGSATGTYAEYAICNVNNVYPLPSNVSFAQGACVGVPCATAHRALHCRGELKKGESVFIHGASGAVGLAAIQLAVRAGARVVGSAGTKEGMDAVRDAGAHGVVNHREDGYLEKALASGGEFDLVLEMAADVNLISDLTVLASNGGRIAIVGSKAQEIGLNPRLTMPKELDIRGVFLGNSTKDELLESHADIYNALHSGELSPVVATEIPLKDARLSHAEVMTPQSGGSAGNVVLVV